MGQETFFLTCGVPIIPALATSDAIRIGPDVSDTWNGIYMYVLEWCVCACIYIYMYIYIEWCVCVYVYILYTECYIYFMYVHIYLC
jgi:hypothetical protein